jgi:hypothetical protein
MNGFVKIDCNILYSSIWAESSETRIIWITLLAMANQNGIVPATAPGISSAAFVSLSETRKAIALLEAPDPDSKSLENEGRRIERVEGGYLILNYDKYRAFNYSMKDEAIYMREYRDKKKKESELKEAESYNVITKSLHSASASASASNTKETLTKETIQKKKDIDIFSTHLLSVLKMPLSDKGKTEELLKELGLESMTAAVNRMKVYFDTVKQNKWTEYIIGKHWRNLYEKIQYFTSDENLEKKIIETMKANTKIDKPDCRTVSTDFSSDEKIMLEQREKKNG